MIYKNEKTREIRFPLGGIGTGCVHISGRGSLVDWEIKNRPNKNSTLGMSHFAIKAEDGKKVLDARVMNSDLPVPYVGGGHGNFGGYGFGPNRDTLAGIPHFKDAVFKGEFPIAEVSFKDKAFPGNVKLTAWNPFIPLNDKDSTIPGAFFEASVRNSTKKTLTYTIALTTANTQGASTTLNEVIKKNGISLLKLGAIDSLEKEEVGNAGSTAIATDAVDTAYQQYWFRGRWFDSLGIWWRDFTKPGKLKNRVFGQVPGERKGMDHGVITARVKVKPGKTEKVRFVLTWHFPEMWAYWKGNPCDCSDGSCKDKKPPTWKPYYAVLFGDSTDSALYSLKEYNRLWKETKSFKDALFASTVPEYVIDAVSANISILKSPTVLRLEDGQFYGFEGCHCGSGCCEGSCTHVWNYAYALPHLFPALERSMRDLNFKYNMDPDGGLRFRLQLPLGREYSGMRPCADGQFGDILKMYREWKISGDTEWLRGHWDSIKKAIAFAWSKKNADKWDPDKSGVLTGRQHHTLDMELFEPNSWLTSFYLGALKAAAEMGVALGDEKAAAEYLALFDTGRKWVDKNLFNGEFYYQKIRLGDKKILDKHAKSGGSLQNTNTVYEAYWDEEHKEIKYQIGEGSSIDQVLGQWHADCMGLGDLLDRKQVKKALKSVYKYNFKPDMHDWFNPCRLYCLQDEAGTVMADWPKDKRKPMVPVPYTEETFHGCEYASASHMILNGFVKEGLEMTKAVRDRYDGERRNPWNEIECGSNYARSMASYAVLTALGGFEYDMVKGMIGFDPRFVKKNTFSTFWSLDPAWGTFEMKGKKIDLVIKSGSLSLNELRLPFLKKDKIKAVRSGAKTLNFTFIKGGIVLSEPVEVKNKLTVFLK